jgi:uncharacterized cupin superfamily protein
MRSASRSARCLREQGGDGFFELVEGDRVAAIDAREGAAVSDGDLLARTAGRAPAAATDLTARSRSGSRRSTRPKRSIACAGGANI